MIIKVERIHKLDTDKALKGFVDVNIEDSIILRGLRIVDGKNGLFIGMPTERSAEGKYYDRINIVNEEIKKQLEEVVLLAYNNPD